MRTTMVLMFLLMLVSLCAEIGEGQSGVFSLDTAAPGFDWQTPDGGETWLTNQPVTLEWTTTETHPTTLDLEWSEDNGGAWGAVFTGQTDTGSHSWTIPLANTDLAKLRLVMTDSFGNQGFGVSGLFTIRPGDETGYSSMFSLDTVAPVCSLQSPSGGEDWYVGDTHDILWTASDSHFDAEPIQLVWSDNGGGTWTDIQNSTTNTGTHAWIIPNNETSNARVKVTAIDQFGNATADSSAVFEISYVPLEAPVGMDCDIVGQDAVISWDPVTQNIYGSPVNPDGYIVLYNEHPGEIDEEYYFLGYTPDSTYTHQYVASFRDSMWYRVVAYKDYSDRIPEVLASLSAQTRGNQSREHRVTWAEVRRRINHVMTENKRRNQQ